VEGTKRQPGADPHLHDTSEKHSAFGVGILGVVQPWWQGPHLFMLVLHCVCTVFAICVSCNRFTWCTILCSRNSGSSSTERVLFGRLGLSLLQIHIYMTPMELHAADQHDLKCADAGCRGRWLWLVPATTEPPLCAMLVHDLYKY
jgi:hypothetical protein